MKIVLTGSISNIGKPLTEKLIANGHDVTVISSKNERVSAIEALGAKAVIGSMFDVIFLSETFRGADIVYLMETLDAVGSLFDPELDFIAGINTIANNYKNAILQSGVTQIVHLSSIGAHTTKNNGILKFHTNAENTLRELPENIAIKFMRPVGFYTNMFSFIPNIKSKNIIIANYGGDTKMPWVSPLDIATVIAKEMESYFEGRSFQYIASDEISPNEIATILGNALGKPDLKWIEVTDEELLQTWLSIGFNKQIASGFIEMQSSKNTGALYEDYYKHKPLLEKTKLSEFAKQFAEVYQQS
ncbi:NAD(P)H-binding protein [Zhouia sp. PK063]|uniref:NmrA family NAD(P)-binding protein n=1 Tax=Zhouia sp. PK063 TaxID=3373602 RepID=UPI00378B184E